MTIIVPIESAIQSRVNECGSLDRHYHRVSSLSEMRARGARSTCGAFEVTQPPSQPPSSLTMNQ